MITCWFILKKKKFFFSVIDIIVIYIFFEFETKSISNRTLKSTSQMRWIVKKITETVQVTDSEQKWQEPEYTL